MPVLLNAKVQKSRQDAGATREKATANQRRAFNGVIVPSSVAGHGMPCPAKELGEIESFVYVGVRFGS